MGIFTGLNLRNMSLTRLTQEFGIMGQVFYDFSRVIDNWPVISTSLTKYHIKYHHQDEADGTISRNPIPNRNPTAAGTTDHRPLSATISIDGISNDHTDAATITPDAKPSSVFCNRIDISSFIKNTKAEPSIVPSSGINSPMVNVVVIGCKDTSFSGNIQYSKYMKNTKGEPKPSHKNS